jgi:multimeric flavodoxin WrbA
MHKIYDAVEKNDIIILATPIYFSGPSSILKQVIDRFQCVWTVSKGKKRGKTAALIAAGGSPSPVFANTISIAKAFAMTVGAEWSGELTISGTDGIKEIPEEMFREAYSFGSRTAVSRL